jgi:hypothetical protein
VFPLSSGSSLPSNTSARLGSKAVRQSIAVRLAVVWCSVAIFFMQVVLCLLR